MVERCQLCPDVACRATPAGGRVKSTWQGQEILGEPITGCPVYTADPDCIRAGLARVMAAEELARAEEEHPSGETGTGWAMPANREDSSLSNRCPISLVYPSVGHSVR